MEPIITFTSPYVVLPAENIDTDQIIPARFLKVTDKRGLGQAAFADWRVRADGSSDPAFVLNRPEAQNAQVLVAGRNFGCGSSREHAPWALQGAGFRAVISTYFADIFRSNALNNGLLPVTVGDDAYHILAAAERAVSSAVVTIDLAAQSLTLPDGSVVPFPIDPFAKHCLLNGVDQLGFLLAERTTITQFETDHLHYARTS